MAGPRTTRWSAPRGLEIACLGLAAALAAWTGLVAGGRDGRSTPVLLLLAGLVGAVLLGRRLAAWPGLVPKAGAAAIAGAFVLTLPGMVRPGGEPTGYANANATLAAVGAIAGVAAACQVPPGRQRQAWTLIGASLVVATVLTRSSAGVVVLAVAGALVLAAARTRWPPLAAAGGAVAVSVALALTAAMAVEGAAPRIAPDAARVELWTAAADLARDEPVRGLGPGAFEERNPVTDDADLRWVHHEYVELAVELGGVGLVLVLSLGVGVLARLSFAGREGAAAAAAVTVVALHGTVDHVWHAPAALLVTALLVGEGIGAGFTSRRRRPPSVAESARTGPDVPLPVT